MNYFVFKSFTEYIYAFIEKIGVDTFVSVSIILWVFFIYNIIRKGTRF